MELRKERLRKGERNQGGNNFICFKEYGREKLLQYPVPTVRTACHCEATGKGRFTFMVYLPTKVSPVVFLPCLLSLGLLWPLSRKNQPALAAPRASL